MKRTRLEPKPPMPLKPGFCDWCGERTDKRKSYCGAGCRVQYNNLLARQGKSVMQMLLLWRATRGRKGTRGQGLLTEIAERVDGMLAENRERIRELKEL